MRISVNSAERPYWVTINDTKYDDIWHQSFISEEFGVTFYFYCTFREIVILSDNIPRHFFTTDKVFNFSLNDTPIGIHITNSFVRGHLRFNQLYTEFNETLNRDQMIEKFGDNDWYVYLAYNTGIRELKYYITYESYNQPNLLYIQTPIKYFEFRKMNFSPYNNNKPKCYSITIKFFNGILSLNSK